MSPVPLTRLTARVRKANEKYIIRRMRETLLAVLTGEQRPSTSVPHSGSAVRPEPSEPWRSIREQSDASSPPPPCRYPNSVIQSGG